MTELGENPGIKMGLFSDPASRRVLVNILLVVGLYLVIGLLRPAFLSSGSFWSLSQQTSVLLLVALGATFVVMMGMIDLSIGSLVTLSAMVLAVSHPMLGDGAVLFAIAVTTAVGALNGVVITAFRLPSFLVTLGSLSIIQGVTLTISPSYVRFQSDLVDFIAIQRLFGVVPVLTVIAVVMAVLFVLVARYSVFGRGAYAIGGGEKVAQLLGLPIRRYKIAAFAISGFTCAIAGVILAGQVGAGNPQIGARFLLDAIAAIAVGGTALSGGVGGPFGTVIGAAIITLISSGLVYFGAAEELQLIVKGLVVILAVYFTMKRGAGLIVK